MPRVRRRLRRLRRPHRPPQPRRTRSVRRRLGGPVGRRRDYKACVAFDTGGLGDKGFNDLAKKGLEDAAALGYPTAFSEAQGATDYASNIQRLIDEDCQTIVTVGFNQAQATIDATLANPDDRLRPGRRDLERRPAPTSRMGTADDMPFPAELHRPGLPDR